MIETQNLVPVGTSRIPNWASGSSYVVGDQVISPITFIAYVRKTNGGGVTDPSADTTNWAPMSLTIKKIIKGSISLGAVASDTATIVSVVTSRSQIFNLGVTNSTTGTASARIELTSSTTVTAYTPTAPAGTTVVGYLVVEYY